MLWEQKKGKAKVNIYTQVLVSFVILGFSAFFCGTIAYLASDTWRKKIDEVSKG